ncbi:M23 family metallopeptidase [Aquimarina gracilis]|uniref:M23 family metallopeptidase n=1 Tax=Aquimarina gracilis TaxID=874422 RepID=A0ABU5ZY72_9FLAO|nr:M23 family metallopeptidase [Aquimarina gracilis]MEB3346819.1 M23 family metallopeptidase [Aquimarina gracilis]
MKIFLSIVLCTVSVLTYAQDNFKLYYEETNNGFKLLADNDEYTPVSTQINLKLENLNSSNGNSNIYVVPAKTKKYTLTELNVIDRRKRVKFGFESAYNYGDHTLKKYNKDFEYYLPFEKGATFWLSQGYNGAVSHKNENALDFKMPVGTKIHAARGGIVVDIEESYSKRCTNPECAKYNNFIVIYHDDGTFAEYTHIKKDGAKVKVGDQVKIGQLIGYSGEVGWATGPHLHFIVFRQTITDRITLKTKFLIGKGKEAIELIEKEQYTRAY